MQDASDTRRHSGHVCLSPSPSPSVFLSLFLLPYPFPFLATSHRLFLSASSHFDLLIERNYLTQFCSLRKNDVNARVKVQLNKTETETEIHTYTYCMVVGVCLTFLFRTLLIRQTPVPDPKKLISCSGGHPTNWPSNSSQINFPKSKKTFFYTIPFFNFLP